MERLYLDNFRGFSDQFIEIRDVNFLVGENSSGKSSVLLILNILNNPGFWFNLEFQTSDFQIYSFEDIVSVDSQDKSSFRIGIFNDSEGTSFLFEFKNLNGKPVIFSGVIEKEGNIFIFYCENDHVTYKIIKEKKISLEMLLPISVTEKNSLEKLSLQMKAGFIPPIILLQMCDSIIHNKKNGFQGKLPIWGITPIAPIRSKPRKTYDEHGTTESPEGDHIPYEIRRLHKSKNDLLKSINNFGIQSGMYKKINIKEYGTDDDIPFRMNFVLNKNPINIINIGYGVSQVLPILYNMYTQNNTIITIQQPEVHLHPKAQAALGDVFFDLSSNKKKKKLIIETHSDYIIDRFRQRQKKSEEKYSVQTLFFLREKGINRVFPIIIDDNGNYDTTNQPDEFREFFIKEELENLGLQS